MRKIGFLISKKENELRRALTYEDFLKIKNKKYCYFEECYFNLEGIKDEEISKLGANVLPYHEVITSSDILIDPKIGDSKDLELMKDKIIFGWIHATQNKEITDIIIKNNITALAFEKMFKGTQHLFYKNNEIAGAAAIYHSMLCYGKSFEGLNAAILGNGNTARGAKKALENLGANIRIYTHAEEKEFQKDLGKYDILVNAILWDVYRTDHIIYREDLKRLKKQALIIDVSCDRAGGIETSIPTTIENPTYEVDGIMHYVVDHTPTFLYKDATKSISEVVINYIDPLIEDAYLSTLLEEALIIDKGVIKDEEINKYQKRG